jgi:hypothetical protein
MHCTCLGLVVLHSMNIRQAADATLHHCLMLLLNTCQGNRRARPMIMWLHLTAAACPAAGEMKVTCC